MILHEPSAAGNGSAPSSPLDVAQEPPQDLIDTKHAARVARTHIGTIRRWIWSGKLQAWRIGARWLVSRSELLSKWQRAGELAQARSPGVVLPSTRREMRARERAVDAELRRLGVRK